MTGNEKKQNTHLPLYAQLMEHYREAILTHTLKPGSRIDSINEIIQKHQVSRETAKLVLKLMAKEGLIHQYPGKGSFVADLRPPEKIWAVVLPFYSAQYENLLSHLVRKALERGRKLRHFIDYNNWEEEIRLVGRLINERYEAIIVVPTLDESKTADFYSRLMPQGTHVALIDHTMAGSYFNYVVQSYDLGVKRGMQHLLDNTQERIAFVRNEIWMGRNLIQELMEETYKEIMYQQRKRPPLIIDRTSAISRSFCKTHHIDGFFCCDDTDAIRVLGKLKEEGFYPPHDFSLVSYGNTELTRYFTPSITSIDPHNSEMADMISGIIQKSLDGINTEMCQYVVQPELIVRQT